MIMITTSTFSANKIGSIKRGMVKVIGLPIKPNK